MLDGSRNRTLAQRAIAEAWSKCSELNGSADGDAKVTLLVIISLATIFKFGNQFYQPYASSQQLTPASRASCAERV
jgi:hypothetical protein